MQTPPSVNPRTGTIFLNYRGEGRAVPVDQEFMRLGDVRLNPKAHQRKELFPNSNQGERENMGKMMEEMKKQLTYLDSTRWMYENNDGVLPMDNFSFINL